MGDGAVVAGAALAVAAAVLGWSMPVVAALGFVAVALVTRRPEPLILAVAVVVAAHASASVAALEEPLPEQVHGVAELVSDPQPDRFGTSVIVRVDGRRYLASFDRRRESVVRRLLTGERVVLSGSVRRFGRSTPDGWRLSRHLAGRIQVDDARPGRGPAPWYRLANGVHRLLARGAESFEPSDRALYLGLVVGDDRAQDDLDRFRFRASGLGHLLAVSGQNVAFLMIVTAPLRERLPMRSRYAAGLAVLVLFVLVTRAEPSVLRATAMCATTLTAVTAGRLASGARILSLAVMGLMLVDPLLVHSLGFRLSVGATAGLLLLTRPLMRALPGPPWLSTALATTLAAQAGATPFLVWVGGAVPAASVPANLLAVPAAGLVMSLGLTAGLLAGLLATMPASVLQFPARLLVTWVDGVATAGSRLPAHPLDGKRLAFVALAVLGLAHLARHHLRARGKSTVMACTAAVVALATLPVAPGPGVHPLAGQGSLMIDSCGTRRVALGELARTEAVLDALWRMGVTRASEVRGEPQHADVAAQIAEQLGARNAPGPVPAGTGPCGKRVPP